MAIKGYMESTLTTSEIWEGINSVQGEDGNTLEKVINLIKTAQHLTNEDIEAAYISVRQITDTLTKAAMKAFDDGRIVLLYNRVPAKAVSQSLPFITLKTGGVFKTYVFMDKYITINRDEVLTVQAPILRDLLTGALISNSLKSNYSMVSDNPYMQKTLMDIYSKFVTRVLNRQFSIMSDKICLDVIQYWINKFFLINILGATNAGDNIELYSRAHFRYIDDLKIEEITTQYNSANPTKFSDLLELVKTASARMRSLNMGLFMNDWINYYYPAASLAPDVLEYLLFMIIALISGTNIISINAADVVKETRNIKSFRGELLKIVL